MSGSSERIYIIWNHHSSDIGICSFKDFNWLWPEAQVLHTAMWRAVPLARSVKQESSLYETLLTLWAGSLSNGLQEGDFSCAHGLRRKVSAVRWSPAEISGSLSKNSVTVVKLQLKSLLANLTATGATSKDGPVSLQLDIQQQVCSTARTPQPRPFSTWLRQNHNLLNNLQQHLLLVI